MSNVWYCIDLFESTTPAMTKDPISLYITAAIDFAWSQWNAVDCGHRLFCWRLVRTTNEVTSALVKIVSVQRGQVEGMQSEYEGPIR
jgi:hypothetical protein